jgi:hypothetical protein
LSSDGGPIDHASAFELLPWLVNDSLSAAEREAVELHARDCIACRREIKEQQRLFAALQAQPLVHLSAQNAFAELSSQLDGNRHERHERHERHAWRDPAYVPFLRFGVVAALGVALVGLLLWITPGPPQSPAGYATLATEPTARTAQLDLIFTEQTTAAEMQALLDAIGGEIVAGPDDVGRYGVRLTSGAAGDADLEGVLERLASDAHVRFAARAYTESPQ